MGYGSYMAELIIELTAERVSHRELFHTLVKFFSLIDSSPLREDYLRIF
jgi:Recombination protein O C terminal.